MCDFKSGILLKDRVYVADHDSHNQMLSELGLRDDFDTASKLFVRVELSPADGDKASDVDGWKLKVDQDILPDWWQEPIDLPRIKAAVKDWCAKHILTSGVHEVRDGTWYALDNATVKALDNATVEALDNATVEAWGSATVKALDNATVKALDNATVKAGGSATVKAGGNATVEALDNATVEAWGSATVKAWGSATVKALDNATVKAGGSATVKAGGNATVIHPYQWYGKPNVTVADGAVFVNHNKRTIATKADFAMEV